MRNYAIFLSVLVLALASMACGFNFQVDLPEINTIDIGPTITEDILVPYPTNTGDVSLEIAFGLGELTISPGAEEGLVQGTATYNVAEFKPKVVIEANSIRLQQGERELTGLPTFGKDMVMEWDLSLSDDPMELVINGGANKTSAELGGLSFTKLVINQGAADSQVTFSELNQIKMESMEVNAGAANLDLIGLANSNITDQFIFKGGAGNYTLDFSGALQQDMQVTIEAGLGNVIIIIPDGVPANLTMQGALSNVNTSGGWEKIGNEYTQEGSGFQITLKVTMGAGNVDLRN
jgi:hypothetical protein